MASNMSRDIIPEATSFLSEKNKQMKFDVGDEEINSAILMLFCMLILAFCCCITIYPGT